MINKTTLKKIKQANTGEELLGALELDNFDKFDISYRGGGLGFYASTLARLIGVDENLLANNFGAYCNFLGGGLRGAIVNSADQFLSEVSIEHAEVLNAIAEACGRAYESYENEDALNDEEYPDGDTN